MLIRKKRIDSDSDDDMIMENDAEPAFSENESQHGSDESQNSGSENSGNESDNQGSDNSDGGGSDAESYESEFDHLEDIDPEYV